ncbi:MAG: P1 family peptidase [Chloroflexi bacterium]|nr:P1 family peptidase [Chloroflexota bacterium]
MMGSIAYIPGIEVGHHTDTRAATGCTVVLCPEGAVASAYVAGAAPGTREAELLRPGSLVGRVHGIALSGGSAFGLDVASGVMRHLEERGIGFDTKVAKVPIVPAAIVFDLALGDPRVRPGAEDGYRACQGASAAAVAEGSVGAGTGATVGKALGPERATKGGLGSASATLSDGTRLAALVVANAFGHVVDPDSGHIVAGPRPPEGGFADSVALLQQGKAVLPQWGVNTTLVVLATDAPLTREQAYWLARMAGAGVAQAVRPALTMLDGDVVFCLALPRRTGPVDLMALGAVAARVVAEAIVRAVRLAPGLGGIPSAREWLEAAA